MEEQDNKNLLIATLLSVAIMFGWFLFFGPDPETQTPTEATQEQDAALGTENAPAKIVGREDAIDGDADRVIINTPRLSGSIALTGGRLDDLLLSDYKQTLDPNSPDVSLLSPENTAQSYFVQPSYIGDNAPDYQSEWTLISGQELTPTTPIVLGWTAPNGAKFEREIAIDENYMFTLTDRANGLNGDEIQPFAYISYLGGDSRVEPKDGARNQSGFILHQGAIRDLDGKIIETNFKKIEDGPLTNRPGEHVIRDDVEENGWVGVTTKYWMTVLVPQPGEGFQSWLRHQEGSDLYSAGINFKPQTVSDQFEHSFRLYAGAKEVELIREYRDDLNINRFDDSVDWGWFYFLTKPIFSTLHWLHGLLGNMGLAIIALTFVIKAILFPLAYRSNVSMSKMKKLQPQMEQIKESAGGDRVKLQQMTMELYRKEKVSPVSGCLPILLQIPIFFSLYKVLYVTTELRHAPFFGPWQDLSAPDPTSIWNLFGLLPWAGPSPDSFFFLFALGILPILLGISMWLTQKLNPTPTDPTQKMIFAWMPWVFMIFMGSFASGLLVYWITNNVLTFVQQYTIMRSQGVKPDIFGNILGRKSA